MVRIRGTIGDWPVDLTVELDETEWAQLGGTLKTAAPASVAVASTPVSQDDAVWEMTKALLRKAGHMLLAQLEALTGSTGAGKRLLVRLRHSPQVQVASGADSPVYSWVE